METVAPATAIGRGFRDPVHESQRCFRAILTAMAEPGRRVVLDAVIEPPPELLMPAALALLTLADHDTPVWLAPALAGAMPYLRFHSGARAASHPGEAAFALLDGTTAPGLARFHAGDDAYPDRSTTIVVQCADLAGGEAVTLIGPGIRGSRRIAPSGLAPTFWPEVSANAARYPLGVDLVLASPRELLCLPRSTRIADAGDMRPRETR